MAFHHVKKCWADQAEVKMCIWTKYVTLGQHFTSLDLSFFTSKSLLEKCGELSKINNMKGLPERNRESIRLPTHANS